VRVDRLGVEYAFEDDESVRTEISRKFTPESGRRLLEQAGFEVVERFVAPGGDYSLWLARARG